MSPISTLRRFAGMRRHVGYWGNSEHRGTILIIVVILMLLGRI